MVGGTLLDWDHHGIAVIPCYKHIADHPVYVEGRPVPACVTVTAMW
jgi:hypothetical protein